MIFADPLPDIPTDIPNGLPTGILVDFNGQVMVGAPDVTLPGISLLINASVFDLTLSQLGEWA